MSRHIGLILDGNKVVGFLPAEEREESMDISEKRKSDGIEEKPIAPRPLPNHPR